MVPLKGVGLQLGFQQVGVALGVNCGMASSRSSMGVWSMVRERQDFQADTSAWPPAARKK